MNSTAIPPIKNWCLAGLLAIGLCVAAEERSRSTARQAETQQAKTATRGALAAAARAVEQDPRLADFLTPEGRYVDGRLRLVQQVNETLLSGVGDNICWSNRTPEGVFDPNVLSIAIHHELKDGSAFHMVVRMTKVNGRWHLVSLCEEL